MEIIGTRTRATFRILFYNEYGRFLSGGIYGFEAPVEKNLKAWVYEWMKINCHLKPMIWRSDYLGMRVAK